MKSNDSVTSIPVEGRKPGKGRMRRRNVSPLKGIRAQTKKGKSG